MNIRSILSSKVILCFVMASIFLFSSCKNSSSSTTAIVEENQGEWISLFDGTTTDGWRAYNGKELPSQWVIEDGNLTFDINRKLVGVEHQGGKDIIYAAEEFENFDLHLEWKIPEGGNSGIFYHLKEGYKGPYEVSPEYQLIDDENYASLHDLTDYNLSLGHTQNPDKLQELQKTAADYAMYPADAAKKILHPAGEWNTTRILFTPEKVEHWLNGQMVLSFVPWSEDWLEKKNSGKWKDMPDYGKFKTGFIGLQDHDSPLWFRNIKIKKL